MYGIRSAEDGIDGARVQNREGTADIYADTIVYDLCDDMLSIPIALEPWAT